MAEDARDTYRENFPHLKPGTQPSYRELDKVRHYSYFISYFAAKCILNLQYSWL